MLARDRDCVICGKPATVADHYPHSRKKLARLGLNPDNPVYGRGLCDLCHNRETAKRQPGGYITPR